MIMRSMRLHFLGIMCCIFCVVGIVDFFVFCLVQRSEHDVEFNLMFIKMAGPNFIVFINYFLLFIF